FIVVLTIGFIYAKRSNTSTSEYFLGGRKVGPWFTALSAEASDMSGYLLMGLPGLAYFTGAADVGWTVIGLAIGTYLNWLLVAKRLRRYSVVANDSITLPGFYSNRFHDDKNTVGTIAAIIILIFFCVYTGSCFVTCGKLFNTLFGWDYSIMMVFGAIIVFLYTMIGGYLSVVATDFVQGTLMFFALAVVLIGSITMIGGVDNTVAFLSDIPGYLSMSQTATPVLDASGTQMVEGGMPLFGAPAEYGLLTIISTMSWGLGYFGMPQVLVRFMGIRSEQQVRQSRIIAIVWMVISVFCAASIGFIGRALMPTELLTQSSAESIFIVMSQIMLPAFFCGIVVSGILAASMSSASSYLLITGSSVAENIYRSIFKKDATDEQVLIVSRITLACVLLFGIVVAWDSNSVIFTVVSYAWAGLGASFGPLTLFSLYWKRTTKQGAIAGMITGAATVIVWHNLIRPLGGVFGIYELLPAFLLGCLAIVIGSKLSPEPSQAVLDDFERYQHGDVNLEGERNIENVLEDGMTLNN
ncbi:MAG: sodium/proline symporter, partial [Coriobacteriales bacterium]